MLRTNGGRTRRVAALAGLITAAGALQANAANPESVTAEVEFVAPITITENNALQYGLLDVNMANAETVVVGTDDSVTDAGSNVLGGTQAAADLTVAATAAQSITILVDNVSSGSGYALGTFLCSYDGGADTACDGGGMSATSVASAVLEIGATLTGDGTATVGAANGSFDVTVSYQ